MTCSLLDDLLAALPADPLLRELAVVMTSPTGTSSAGWPYLAGHAWVRFRDWVPHLQADGHAAWLAVDRLVAEVERLDVDPQERASFDRASRVVRQVLKTAAVTAPAELWLLRAVLSQLHRAGVLDRFAQGEIVSDHPGLRTDELAIDLHLLLARHLVGRAGDGWRWIDLPVAQRMLHELAPLPERWPWDLSARWASALRGSSDDVDLLADILDAPVAPGGRDTPAWVPSPAHLDLGWRQVPLVLGLRSARSIAPLLAADVVATEHLDPLPPPLRPRVLRLLDALGARDADGRLTPLGRRMVQRGPGPFGIIEAYHPYLAQLPQIWAGGRGSVHVERAANVAASQDANRKTFTQANDALDAFCAETGFGYRVFIEHAVGKGEATRQRHARSGDGLTYVGADLEDAAIDAARAEQDAGRLPADMRFVRSADIGRPELLLDQLDEWGIDATDAVMVVGNGFHEVRGQTDDAMTRVFAGYERAGIVLLFTEESALSVEDLLTTAWNTYHGAFRYVHDRSGQVLRPANAAPPSSLGAPLPASWTECATDAGYVRIPALSSRSRTVHPYPPASGVNPSISVNHFFVPGSLAARLGLTEAGQTTTRAPSPLQTDRGSDG